MDYELENVPGLLDWACEKFWSQIGTAYLQHVQLAVQLSLAASGKAASPLHNDALSISVNEIVHGKRHTITFL